MSQKGNCKNDSDSDPKFEPGMQLSGGLSLGDSRKRTCAKPSCSQSHTKQQSVKRSNGSSRHKSLNTSNREAVVTTHSASTEAGYETGFPALTILPEEMWLKIFQHCVSTDGPVPFLLRAGRVCRTWRDLAMDPVLWEELDLSCGPIKRNLKCLKWLAPNRLSGCRKIILNGWHSSTDKAVKLIVKHCPQLQTIDLSRNSRLTCRGVTHLFQKCRKLKHVDLSYTSPSVLSSICTQLRDAGVQGSSIECLWLTVNMMEQFNLNFEVIVNWVSAHWQAIPATSYQFNLLQEGNSRLMPQSLHIIPMHQQGAEVPVIRNCPRLKELHLGSSISLWESLDIDVNLLRASCPLLRVLDFCDIPLCIKHTSQETQCQAQANGLVHLQVLRCGQVLRDPHRPGEHGVLDFLVPKLLHNSAQLKVLELCGYPEFDASVLLSLPAKALEELNFSRSGVTGHVLQEIFKKWQHSLTWLDLSYLSLDPSELEAAFKILTDLPTCPLRELRLFHCKTLFSCVRMLTGKLKHLEVLQLARTGLPDEISHMHEGQHNLKRLHHRVCELEELLPATV